MRKWIVDASPLILLAKIDQIHRITRLPDALAIPAPVAEEIQAGLKDDPARGWLLHSGSEYVQPVPTVEPEVAAWDLGRGERAALSLAYRKPTWTVIVDDLAARRCARALSIPFSGTIGVILAAKHEKVISEVDPLLYDLIRAGLRISEDVITQARRLAGEM